MRRLTEQDSAAITPQRFKVTITETLKRAVEVEADDPQEAEQMVSDGWHDSKYILCSEDFAGVAFEAAPTAEETDYSQEDK